MSFVTPGQYLDIPAGKRIIRNGNPARQLRSSTVRVYDVAQAPRGKTRVFWKSQGYTNSALV